MGVSCNTVNIANKHIAGVGKSDHDGLLFTYVCSSGVTSSYVNKNRLNFRRGNYLNMNQFFSNIEREEEMADLSCEEAWQFLKQKYDHAVKDADTRCLLLTGRKAISC